MKSIKKIFLFALLLLIILVGYVLVNTFAMKSKQLSIAPVDKIDMNSTSIDNFSKAIKIRTVSPENIKDFDSIPFRHFNEFLKMSYPMVDSLLEHKIFNEFSHLYFWKGSDPVLKPIILMGHVDVVPVIEENRSFWTKEPFGGEVSNDTIYGRGTIDDKVGVIGIMEAVELLLKQGYHPKRSVYLAFGHDEEIGGELGAKAIAAYLKRKNVQAEFIMDEGGSLVSGMIPGIQKDVGLIGIAEKGFLSIELSVEIEGGHSSMPGKETAIDVISGAIFKLKSQPLKAVIADPVEGFLEYLGPEMPFVNRMAFANRDIFNSMIINIYESSASGNALVRTTTAPTIFQSGVKDNIIPLSAKATLNFRIISGESIEDVIAHVEKVIDDDRVQLKTGDFKAEPSKVSATGSNGFNSIHKSIAQVFPEALVSPYLVVGATDARHFGELSDQIYRFLPIRINKSNVKSFHGLNERIAVDEYENSIRFYAQLIANSSN